MGKVDTEWRKEIVYGLDNLPSVILLPESLKVSIADLPEASRLDMYQLPLYGINGRNGKAPPVYQLYEDAEWAGRIFPGRRVYFPSSGGAGLMGVYFKDAFGLDEVVIIVDKTTPPGKQAQIIVPGGRIDYPSDGQTTLERAAQLETEGGGTFINQYRERGSIVGHKRTMNHISIQMRRRGVDLSFFCAAAGTCSTLCAGYEFLKDDFPNIQIVGVGCEGDQTPGARTLANIERDVRFAWKEAVAPYGLVFCDKTSAFAMSRKIIQRTRKPAGPTCGLAVDGFLKRFRYLSEHGELEQFANRQGRFPVVIAFMDASPAYGDEYMKTLNLQP
jgi:cysteine synthase